MRNAIFRSIGRPRKEIVLLMVLAMALVAGPAGAATGTHGEAAGEGQEVSITTGQDYGGPNHLCLEVTDSQYRVDVTGEFYAEDGGDQHAYIGPAELNWETTETYYIAPEGIYTELTGDASDPPEERQCDPASLGDQVEAHIWVDPVNPPDGRVKDCESTEDAYSRLTSEIAVAWTGDCEVETSEALEGPYAPGSGQTGPADHLFEGAFDAGTGTVTGTWVYPDPT